MRSFFIFAIATGLNRGSFFILMPLFALLMPVQMFGELSLSFTVSQLLAPIFSLNVAVIISREVFERRIVSFSFNSLLICFTLGLSISSLIFFLIYGSFFSIVICLAASEALFILISTYIRYVKQPNYFLVITFIKCVTVFLVYSALATGVFTSNADDLIFIIIISFVFANIVSTVCFWPVRTFLDFNLLSRFFSFVKSNKQLFIFAFTMLPHVIAQWAMAGFDRFIIKFFHGEFALGVYALSYSMASLYMIVNSALGLALPQLCVKNYKKFSSENYYHKVFISVTSIWVFVACALYIAIPLLFKDVDSSSVKVALLILVGFYLMSFYYYFSSIVFYQRDVFFLSASTVASACFSVVLTTVLTYYFGIIGAASAQVISYLCYVVTVSSRLDFPIKVFTFYPVVFSSLCVAIICCL